MNQPPVSFQANREHDNSYNSWIQPRKSHAWICTHVRMNQKKIHISKMALLFSDVNGRKFTFCTMKCRLPLLPLSLGSETQWQMDPNTLGCVEFYTKGKKNDMENCLLGEVQNVQNLILDKNNREKELEPFVPCCVRSSLLCHVGTYVKPLSRLSTSFQKKGSFDFNGFYLHAKGNFVFPILGHSRRNNRDSWSDPGATRLTY